MIDDELLPATAHLTGANAFAVLSPAIAATGRRLLECRAVQVQYRPGSDLVVRYRADVEAPGGATAATTLLAATTASGAPRGTLPVEASHPDGTRLEVGVWTWPFDPALPALADVVVPARLSDLLGDALPGPCDVEVVAYRPTERAVVRVAGPAGVVYVKVVPPHAAASLIDIHGRLDRAGLPVPRVLAGDPEMGWLAISECTGPTVRELLKAGATALPTAAEICDTLDRLAAVELPARGHRRSRIADAPAHAAMLAIVLPDARPRLDRLVGLIEGATIERPRLATTHGDLHEAQLVTADGRLTGLIDLDDVGAGDPLEDAAILLGHVRYRALTTPAGGGAIDGYADALRTGFAERYDAAELDLATAAVLVGLATGPFRVQQVGWGQVVTAVLDRALDLARAPVPVGARVGT